jgi:hypothetical protein
MHPLRTGGSDVIEQLVGNAVDAVRGDGSNSQLMGDCYIGYWQETRPQHRAMPNACRKHSVSETATRINIATSDWLVPRDGDVETRMLNLYTH